MTNEPGKHDEAANFMAGVDEPTRQENSIATQPERASDGTVIEANATLERQQALQNLEALKAQIAAEEAKLGITQMSEQPRSAGNTQVPQHLEEMRDVAGRLEGAVVSTPVGQANSQLTSFSAAAQTATNAPNTAPAQQAQDNANKPLSPEEQAAKEQQQAAATGAIENMLFGGAFAATVPAAAAAAAMGGGEKEKSSDELARAEDKERNDRNNIGSVLTGGAIFGGMPAVTAPNMSIGSTEAMFGAAAPSAGDKSTMSEKPEESEGQLASLRTMPPSLRAGSAAATEFKEADAKLAPVRDEMTAPPLAMSEGQLMNLMPLDTPGMGVDRGIGRDSGMVRSV